MQGRLSPRYLAFIDSLNWPIVPNQSTGRRPDVTNFDTFIRLRQEFRAAFASRVLLPCNVSHRIDAMVTAASNAILDDRKTRNINSVLGELCTAGNTNPINPAEAMAFLWVYVGTVEVVSKRGEPIWVSQAVDGQVGRLFKVAVSVDKEKNMPHVAHLWRKLQQCHPPASQFPSPFRILRLAYGNVDVDKIPTPEGGMEQLFDEMSSFYVPLKKPASLLDSFDEDWEGDRNTVKKMETESVKRPVKKEIDPKNQPQYRSDPCSDQKICHQANFQSLINLRQEFRAAFASRVLQPGNIASRIEAMVTAATNAILEDKKKRSMSSILTELCKDGRVKPLNVVEAMAFVWVFVGTVEAARKRNFTFCTGGDYGPLVFILKQAVSQYEEKEKNMTHVAILCKKVRQYLPTTSEFVSRIFKGAYGDVDFNTVPTPEAGMEQLFAEMSSFYGTNPVKKVQAGSVKGEAKDKSGHPVIDNFSLRYRSDPQKISQQKDKDVTPKTSMKPSLSSSTFGPQQKLEKVKVEAPVKEFCRGRDYKSIVTTVKPENVETASSTSKQQRPPDSVQEIRQPTKNKKSAANRPIVTMDNDFLLFLTNPGEYIKMNPSLFPANDVSWSARRILPDPPIKRNKPNNPVEDDDSSVPQVAQQSPVDCMETMLRVDFTPEEYIDQTTASNYYAQGVKIVDGVRRVVFYHKMMINPSDIKKEEPI